MKIKSKISSLITILQKNSGDEAFTQHHFYSLDKLRKKNGKSLSLNNFDVSRPFEKNGAGFTLLELLVVIAIIGVLAGIILFSIAQARIKGRDAKRVGDMRQVIDALEQYHVQNGLYPTGTVSSTAGGSLLSGPGTFDGGGEPMTPNYLPIIPVAPIPADGPCTTGGINTNDYWYQVDPQGIGYTLTFCLGKDTSAWPSGVRTSTPDGVQ